MQNPFLINCVGTNIPCPLVGSSVTCRRKFLVCRKDRQDGKYLAIPYRLLNPSIASCVNTSGCNAFEMDLAASEPDASSTTTVGQVIVIL